MGLYKSYEQSIYLKNQFVTFINCFAMMILMADKETKNSEKSYTFFINKLKWQDYALLFIIILYLILQYNLVSDFKQLPSPIYGGDYYHQLGAVNHVKYGGNAFKNFYSLLDAIPSYLPLYALIVGNIAKIFSLDGMQAMFTFSYFALAISLILFYLASYKLFKNKTLALISTVLYNSLMLFPMLKYREFAKFMIFPYFFFLLYFLFTEENYKRRIFYAFGIGIIYGLGSISHGTLF